MKVQHVVEIYFDMDFGHLPSSEQWVKDRFEFFNRFTLPSLLNQKFKDFRIHVLCGETHKTITKALAWNKRIKTFYDSGRQYTKTIKADFLAVTRIDSDDMYHRLAMEDVHRGALKTLDPYHRRCLIFRKAWSWDQVNSFLAPRFRASPPFYTHIFPRTIFTKWDLFKSWHFIGHGKAGGRLPDTVELPPFRTCVIRHESNVGYDRRGITAPVFSREKMESLRVKFGNEFITDECTIKKILKDFGVDNE